MSSTDWNRHDEFFNYTRGRFVGHQNEAHELIQRHIQFDMNALARVAAHAVGAMSCVDIEKYSDGMYNKAFVMRMDDGIRVVTKVPNPNAGRPHFTTASEVATMDFVRTVCGTPIPRVLAWSSRAEANIVGAEYIIMEMVTGVQVSFVWETFSFKQKGEFVKSLASCFKSWMAVAFNQYGSLYYAEDLSRRQNQPAFSYIDQNGVDIKDRRFAIGPTSQRYSIDYGRALVNFDRGPWNTIEEYCTAIGAREIACVETIQPLPKPLLTLVGQYIPSREKKLVALQCYMKLVRFLLPTDPSITTSHIWHLDLHNENIFVDPDNPTRIVGIIDWQSVSLSPLFENAIQPALLDYDGPLLNGLERPEMPTNLQQLKPLERAIALKVHWDMTLACYYRNFIYSTNKRLYSAIEFRDTLSYEMLSVARNLLIEGEAVYLERVAEELKVAWDTLPGVQAQNNSPYPFHFPVEDLAAIHKDADGMYAGIGWMGRMQDDMGRLFPLDKTARHDKYNDVVRMLWEWKERALREFARDEEERAAVLKWWPWN